ncbi:MAG: hypothetical protein WC069_04405 [Candidatus Shapirobacteria bacterium]
MRLGGAKYNLRARKASIVSQEGWAQTIALEEGVSVEAYDRYYWKLPYSIDLDSKVRSFSDDVLSKAFDQFYKSHDLVEKIVRSQNLSEDQVNMLMEIYSNGYKDQVMYDVGTTAFDLFDKAELLLTGRPDLVENDMNLLKELGAMEYDMFAQVNIPQRLEIVV